MLEEVLGTRRSPIRSLLLALCLVCVAHGSHAQELTGYVVKIADGDTLTVLVDREQVRVRLAEIDTPERGQPWASQARQALAAKVFNRDVRVVVIDMDRYGRTVGRVYVGDRDVCRELVAEGHAWVFRRYNRDKSLLNDEAKARASRRGLWGLSEEPVPPWDWRRATSSANSTEN